MNIDITILENMKTLEKGFIEQRRKSLDLVSFSELNKRKVNMAQIEWYKKDTKNQGIGYYDSYKKKMAPLYHDARVFYKELTTYWTGMVEEAEMQPQKEGANFRKTRFYAGTNYRRMIEPLAIAQYYGEGGKNYVHEKRSKHFEQLEEWLKEGTAKGTSDSNSTSKEKVEAILTIDSCFWAHVEEALLLCRELKAAKEKEEALKKLLEFEEYVYGLLKNYAVSPEIFLPQSSYMHWWNEYKAIKGSSYTSALANFMKDARKLEQYAMGACDFP